MKIIPTKIHGVLDYLSAFTAIALPRILGWNDMATYLLTFQGVAILVYTLITQFELSVFKILPMKWHLALDALGAAVLIGAPFLLSKTGRGEMIGMVALGALELGVVALSQTRPAEARRSVTA